MASKIKIKLIQNCMFLIKKKFGHGKTIQAPIVGDFCSTSDVYYSIIRVIIIKLENAILAEFLE